MVSVGQCVVVKHAGRTAIASAAMSAEPAFNLRVRAIGRPDFTEVEHRQGNPLPKTSPRGPRHTAAEPQARGFSGTNPSSGPHRLRAREPLRPNQCGFTPLSRVSANCAKSKPRPATRDPRPETRDPRPETRDPRPAAGNGCSWPQVKIDRQLCGHARPLASVASGDRNLLTGPSLGPGAASLSLRRRRRRASERLDQEARPSLWFAHVDGQRILALPNQSSDIDVDFPFKVPER